MNGAAKALQQASPTLPEKYPGRRSLPAKLLRPLRGRADGDLPMMRHGTRASTAPLCRTDRTEGTRLADIVRPLAPRLKVIA